MFSTVLGPSYLGRVGITTQDMESRARLAPGLHGLVAVDALVLRRPEVSRHDLPLNDARLVHPLGTEGVGVQALGDDRVEGDERRAEVVTAGALARAGHVTS